MEISLELLGPGDRRSAGLAKMPKEDCTVRELAAALVDHLGATMEFAWRGCTNRE